MFLRKKSNNADDSKSCGLCFGDNQTPMDPTHPGGWSESNFCQFRPGRSQSNSRDGVR